jgi:acetyltransferase-like isoleucine patch superfamily enzyme
MKRPLQKLEKRVLQQLFIRWPILGLDRFVRRLFWLWGRLRFGAAISNRGDGCVCHWNADLKSPENIALGNGVVIGLNVSIGALSPVRIGDHVRISRDVMIESAGLDFTDGCPPYQHVSLPIVIEEGVWIGARALILGGVTVGAYSVIAAGAVVTRSIPAFSIVAGVPARVIGTIRPAYSEVAS